MHSQKCRQKWIREGIGIEYGDEFEVLLAKAEDLPKDLDLTHCKFIFVFGKDVKFCGNNCDGWVLVCKKSDEEIANGSSNAHQYYFNGIFDKFDITLQDSDTKEIRDFIRE